METIAVDLDEVVCPDHEPTLLADAEYCLRALTKWYNLEIVTARNPTRREATGLWVEETLPEVFSAVHFIRDYEGRSVSKAEVCLDIGARYLIDDLDEHCDPAREVGIEVIQFGIDVPDWRGVLDELSIKALTRPQSGV